MKSPPLSGVAVLAAVSSLFCVVGTVRRDSPFDDGFDYGSQVLPQSSNACYSCASSAYLHFWNQLLMHHYFPPKNFTDDCWQPDQRVGSVPCTSACFTIVEEVQTRGTDQAVMRGCVDRWLLFGIDVDVKEAIISYEETCKTVDRQLLQLVPLHQENPLVLMCTCVGKLCNRSNALNTFSASNRLLPSLVVLLSVFLLPNAFT